MLTSEEITKLKEPPQELLEIQLYETLEIIRWRFFNNQIDKEKAVKLKNAACIKYENKVKDYEFMVSMFKEHVQKIKESEILKIKLRKEFTKDTALELIEKLTNERWR